MIAILLTCLLQQTHSPSMVSTDLPELHAFTASVHLCVYTISSGQWVCISKLESIATRLKWLDFPLECHTHHIVLPRCLLSQHL